MSSSSKRKHKDESAVVKPPGGMAAALHWPIHEVLISRNWQEEAALVTILVARISPVGKIAFSLFLVDLGCLGVKSAVVRTLPSVQDYRFMLQKMASAQPMMPTDLDHAAKVLEAGHRFASSLGFKPDPVFFQAVYLLDGAKPESCTLPVYVGGDEGKPLFVAGPYDNALRIIDHLMRQVGEGNFHYIAQVGMDTLMDEEEA